MSCEWRILWLLQLLVLLMRSWETKGECCTPSIKNNGCDDGTRGTPCCGIHRCNIFCCNCTCRRANVGTLRKMCDDHHRRNSHKRRMMEPEANYDWHNRNVNTKAFFAVIAKLLDPNFPLPGPLVW